ncbi:hypothetical protein JIN84_02560 [Luteolibacter yonseiensis]|uniref:Uncharacterized protein n=1 Tax=Luteolibacter yonseiensis TaxID=1144680 RepID=A0A934V8U3_9BACT|nr:hypothetical protein [Luteolibacter yonseiensis]MBK1814478.1 hypothetical protein [Luteolibacter yonseiensis]
MIKSPPILLLALCVTGISSGLVARRLTRPFPATSSTALQTEVDPSIKTVPAVETPLLRSSETVETLAATAPQMLYSRLALWLIDAGEEDIAAFWTTYKQGARDEKITDLVFLHWTRHNPQAATAAVAGTWEESSAWWSWACHDPQAALAAAKGDQIDFVARGLGEFRPKWLRQHFAELPHEARAAALRGMKEWPDPEHPLETFGFLAANDNHPSPAMIRSLARQDPLSALDWAKDQSLDDDPFSDNLEACQIVIDTLASDRPEDLKRFSGQTPSGEMKLRMEAALFGNLVKSDPVAALEEARSSPSPRIAAERYAALGQNVVRSDSEQAFQLAKDLFSACPDAFYPTTTIEFPGGGQRVLNHDIRGIEDFAGSLMEKDPARFMDMVLRLTPGSVDRVNFSHLTREWSERDLGGFTNWLNQQTDETIRNDGAEHISTQLLENGFFEEAMDWELSRRTDNEDNLKSALEEWIKADPEAPARWLESADLPAERKKNIQSFITRLR